MGRSLAFLLQMLPRNSNCGDTEMSLLFLLKIRFAHATYSQLFFHLEPPTSTDSNPVSSLQLMQGRRGGAEDRASSFIFYFYLFPLIFSSSQRHRQYCLSWLSFCILFTLFQPCGILILKSLNSQRRFLESTFSTVLVIQSCLTLSNPIDCSSPGSPVRGILQARKLERVAISFFRGSSQPRNQTQVSCIAGRFFTIWATRDPYLFYKNMNKIYSEYIGRYSLFFLKSLWGEKEGEKEKERNRGEREKENFLPIYLFCRGLPRWLRW